MAKIVCFECRQCLEVDKTVVRVPNMKTMRKHVVITHCTDDYRSFKCGRCDRKYFDMDHFQQHVNQSPNCQNIILTLQPLDPMTETALEALVQQITRPVSTKAVISTANPDPTPMKQALRKIGPILLIDLEAEDDEKDGGVVSVLPPPTASAPVNESNAQPVAPKRSEVGTMTEDMQDDENAEENSDNPLPKFTSHLCELCNDLGNRFPAIRSKQEKEAHAMMHLKFSSPFSTMAESRAQRRPEFAKVLRMCFERGYYEQLLREAEDDIEIIALQMMLE